MKSSSESLLTRFIALALLSLLLGCSGTDSTNYADVCEPAENAQTESCWINDQDTLFVRSVDDFETICQSECSKVFNLRIAGVSGLKNLEVLSGLSHIDRLGVTQNDELKQLAGLEQVDEITEHVRIERNDSLTDLSDLSAVGSGLSDGIRIADNKSLESLKGLNNLRKLGTGGGSDTSYRLEIQNNPKLSDMSALSSLEEIVQGGLLISYNNSLKQVGGLSNLTSLGLVRIVHNTSLQDITGLHSLNEIRESLTIQSNPKLPNCQAQAIADRATVGGSVRISENGSGTCPEN